MNTMKEKFPPKTTTNELKDELDYCQKVIQTVEKEETIRRISKCQRKAELFKRSCRRLQRTSSVIQMIQMHVSGHKTADSSFFGYKTHIAMNEERIITAAVITTGEKSDGKYLQTLIEKSQETGMEIDTIIGDTAYSEKDNIQYANENTITISI